MSTASILKNRAYIYNGTLLCQQGFNRQTVAVKTETGNHNCQILAGIGESGKRSVLISDFKSGADTLELHLRGAENARFHLVRIDFYHDWAESECAARADGMLSLPGAAPGKSQVFLLEEL